MNGAMKLENLTGNFIPAKVIVYNADGTKALYKNKLVRLVEDNIYCGEIGKNEYRYYCDIYALYDGVAVGIWVGRVRTDNTVEEVMEQSRRKGMDTLENYLSHIKNRIAAQDDFNLIEIEFMKHVAPELENQMWESRKAFAENQECRRRAEAEQSEAENQAFVNERNAKAEQAVNQAVEILRNGGILENSEITVYRSRYDYSTYSVVNYLMRKHGINVPIRTQGWINDKLVSAKIENGKCENLRYYREKGAKCSQKFFDCMNELLAVVKAEKSQDEINNILADFFSENPSTPDDEETNCENGTYDCESCVNNGICGRQEENGDDQTE